MPPRSDPALGIAWTIGIALGALLGTVLAGMVVRRHGWPGAAARATREDPGAPHLLLAGVGVLFAAAIGGAAAWRLAGRAGLGDTGAGAWAMGAGSAVGSCAAIAFARAMGYRPGFAWRDLIPGAWWVALSGPVLVLVGSGVALAASALGVSRDQAGHPLLRAFRDNPGDAWIWTSLAGAVLITPVYEELLFRGFVHAGVRRAVGEGWWARVVSAALFAGIHVAGAAEGRVALHALPTLLVLGVILARAYDATRSLGAPIVVHMAFNAANVAMAVVWLG